MFTGIIEKTGSVRRIESKMDRLFISVAAEDFTDDLKPGSSIAVDGVCLTATELSADGFDVDAVRETLRKTTLTGFKPGRTVNLERAVKLGGRLDGHMVQGHVDGTAQMTRIQKSSGNVLISLKLDGELQKGVVKKGSIAIDGISLTVVDIVSGIVTVTIVPFTFEHTTLAGKKAGDTVNIETDIIGKYVSRYLGGAGAAGSFAAKYM